MASLEVGDYTIKVEFTDGYATDILSIEYVTDPSSITSSIDQDRTANVKKPLKDQDNNDDDKGGKIVSVSTSDPESRLFRKGEHKTEFAYTAKHVQSYTNAPTVRVIRR